MRKTTARGVKPLGAGARDPWHGTVTAAFFSEASFHDWGTDTTHGTVALKGPEPPLA
jgi:hypothetical protein